ncbi:MBOAT family protein [Fusibacter paucivorans]|uniref:MBOAT family protein n=1 Tax=Fusibacter paucivorans TaxID=76009 RepID=A0ABS5PMV5_9FIRM|nr:MBOAT family O-acyltransferase [Fusibacter paucivorans]MBS7525916.1 MBOAT family protein [Fusibacter paucivorans]
MVFSSLTFLYLFLPINLVLYFSTKREQVRNGILILFSLMFYAYGEPVWVTLLIFSATVDFWHGKIIERYRGSIQSKLALISSLVVNLSLLGFFKYWHFFTENFYALSGILLPTHHYALPIGISFYTFQTLSYTIDVYRGEVKAQRSYLKFLLFVSLFHQLVAGPIVRYKDIAAEIEHRKVTLAKFSYGVNRFALGLAKKVLIANTAGAVASQVLDIRQTSPTVIGMWFGIAMFAFQIYFDFSGYSDMAIGLGRMFGFTYKENFNYPYMATSATDFWRRWHISLGSFFRDYVYIPLGGKRRFQLRNIFIVWFLTGLWHGASWNFIVWGLFYGILIYMEKLIGAARLAKIPSWLRHGYLLIAMLIGWVFFYYESLPDAIYVISTMFGMQGLPVIQTEIALLMRQNWRFFILAVIACTPIFKVGYIKVKAALKTQQGDLLDALMVGGTLLLATAFLVGSSYNPFLYFRF